MNTKEALQQAKRTIESGTRRDLTYALIGACPPGEDGTLSDAMRCFEKKNGSITNWRVGQQGLTKVLALEAFDRAIAVAEEKA